MTCTDLSAVTIVPVTSPGAPEPPESTSNTSPWFISTVPLPSAATPAPAAIVPPAGGAVSTTVVLSSLAVTA
jgi:hypothetical protein